MLRCLLRLRDCRPFWVACWVWAAPACNAESDAPDPGVQPEAVVEVGVIRLQEQAVVLTAELPGRTAAYETSEVRPQVSGIIQERLFQEGEQVKQGQKLYQIDARVYRAAVAQSRADLQGARATEKAALERRRRFEALAGEQLVSALELTDVRAAAEQATARVEQAEAALQTALVNLRFTEVPAPISGRIGRSLVTTGALVTSGQAQPLATIQRLDPIFVDMQQSNAELLELRNSLARGGVVPSSAEVRLRLEDGTEYPHVGALQFSEAMVDPSTGSVTLRARFENPERLLLPGMYVRAEIAQGQRPKAILAPQRGILRDARGQATALVVEDDRVARREVQTSRTIGDQWLIESGLRDGDQLIVEGTSKVRPGQVVNAVPFAQESQAPVQGAQAPHGER